MNTQTVVCDIDGVLVDAVGPWLRAYEEKTGECVAQNNYDLGASARQPDLLYRCLHEQADEIYAQAPTALGRAILTALLAAQRRTGCAVTFCTYAPPWSKDWARESYLKLFWLQHNAPEDLEWSYFASKDSAKLGCVGTLLVEDNAEKAWAWADHYNALAIIVAQPWNMHASNRVETAAQFRAAIKRGVG